MAIVVNPMLASLAALLTLVSFANAGDVDAPKLKDAIAEGSTFEIKYKGATVTATTKAWGTSPDQSNAGFSDGWLAFSLKADKNNDKLKDEHTRFDFAITDKATVDAKGLKGLSATETGKEYGNAVAAAALKFLREKSKPIYCAA